MSTKLRTKFDKSVHEVRQNGLTGLLQPVHALLFPHLFLLVTIFGGAIVVTAIFSLQPETAEQAAITLTDWSLVNFEQTLTDPIFLEIVTNTLEISALTTFLTFVFAFPAAYALAMKIQRFKLLFIILLILPLVTSINIRVFGWVLMLSGEGILSGVLGVISVESVPQLMYQKWTIILGTTYVYMPFMLFPIYLSFANIEDELIEAAKDLGASRRQIFQKIIFPQSKPGIIIGSLFVFVLSLGATVEADMLGGGQVITLASDITYSFGRAQNWHVGSAKAITMLIIALISSIVILRTVDLEEISQRS